MTRITLAKSAGFCFGVSRSVDMAEKLLESGPCKCLGPLIHNEEVVASLAARGLEVISSPEEAGPGDRVLIRSHGVSRAVEDALRAAGAGDNGRHMSQRGAHTSPRGRGIGGGKAGHSCRRG